MRALSSRSSSSISSGSGAITSNPPDSAMSAKSRVEHLDRLRIGRSRKSDHEAIADVPHRVVVRVEADDLVACGLDVVGDQEEVDVRVRDELPARQLVDDELSPVRPVRAVRDVEQHDRSGRRLAGLQERQQLEGLVEGAEAAGQAHERV